MSEKLTTPENESLAIADIDIQRLSPENIEELHSLYQRNREKLDGVNIYVPIDQEDLLDKIRYPIPEGRMDFCIYADGQIVGEIDLIPQGPKRAELIYWIDQQSQGRGYAKKAVTATAVHAFDNLGIDTLRAWVNDKNVASIKTLERAGFIHEDTNITAESLGYTLTKQSFKGGGES